MNTLRDQGISTTDSEILEHRVLFMLDEHERNHPGTAPRLGELAEAATDEPTLWSSIDDHGALVMSTLETQGLVRVGRTMGPPSSHALRLLPLGKTEAARQKQQRESVAARRNAGRCALLFWLYNEDAAGNTGPVEFTRFLEYPLSYFWGFKLDASDVEHCVRWLSEKGLATMVAAWGNGGGIAHITVEGIDCIEQYSGEIGAYMKGRSGSGQSISIGDNFTGQFGAAHQGSVQQTQNQKVDVEGISKVLGGIRAGIPALGLDAEDAAELEGVIVDIEKRGGSGELDAPTAKTRMERVREIVGRSTTALGPTFVAAAEALITNIGA
ncbi:hypothetical protein GT755_12450 [Herbidospora sp. NEAU-GS84]|uniref:Uncharacterized protein n=1 Tax=Herbidospora solisilvae TaxID=2696284 RepID=A0A7C9N6S9_9ACTN|nr:hypothetical protein [Herbidospora solisilvae]NAS22493.1 hypothetical protein [Herbidospora solisilvae]